MNVLFIKVSVAGHQQSGMVNYNIYMKKGEVRSQATLKRMGGDFSLESVNSKESLSEWPARKKWGSL